MISAGRQGGSEVCIQGCVGKGLEFTGDVWTGTGGFTG